MDRDQVINGITQCLEGLEEWLGGRAKGPHRGNLLTTMYRGLKDWLKSPLRRKLLTTIYNDLKDARAELQACPSTGGPVMDHQIQRLKEVLAIVSPKLPEDTAWDVADDLKTILASIAQDPYLYRQLCAEKQRDRKGPLGWSDYFEGNDLKKLLADYGDADRHFKTKGSRHRVAQRLQTLYAARNDAGRHHRARVGMRARYVSGLSVVLLALIIAVVVLPLLSVSDGGAQGGRDYGLWLRVLCAGAVGASLSLALKLRDLDRLLELRAAWTLVFAQVVIGATLAAIVIVILDSGIITIIGIDPASQGNTLVPVALVAGFSEPFALGILGKVASLRND